MRIVDRLSVKRSKPEDKLRNIRTVTVAEAAAEVKDKKTASTMNEYLTKENPVVIPFLDSEEYFDERPSQAVHKDILEKFKKNIVTLMQDQDGYELGKTGFAERHGVDAVHGKYKVSYRAFLFGWTVDYTKMPRLIKSKGLGGDTGGLFDVNPYKENEQLLACILGRKGYMSKTKKNDDRVLKPITDHALEDFFVQNVKGVEKEVRIPDSPRVDVPESSRPVPSASMPTDETRSEQRVDSKIVDMLNILKQERWDARESWISLAILLKNLGGEAYYAIWLKLSQTSRNFTNETDSRKDWETAGQAMYTGRRLTVGSLHRWAKEDDLTEYMKIAFGSDKRWQKSDLGLVEMAADLCGDRLKLDPDQNKWYAFDSATCKWREVGEATIKKTIGDELRRTLCAIRTQLSADAAAADGEDSRQRSEQQMKTIGEVIRYVSENRGLRNIVSLGSDMFAEKGFMMKLDTSKHLLGVRNGVIDLRTGKLRQALPEDMVCRELEVEYDECIETEFVENLILTIQADDQEMATYMQKLLGYGLTGEVCEEIFVFFTQSGRNGKGVLLNSLDCLLNNTGYYVQGNMGLMVNRKVSNIDAERAKLHGSRFLIFNEMKPGDEINLDDFKSLSGGDGIPAAAKYGAPFTVQPQYLPLCANNNMPKLPLVDVATIERCVVIEFPVTFGELQEGEEATKFRRQRDNGLKSKMQEKRKELLRWLVQGSVMWYETGGLKRDAPEKVKAFTKQYLHEQDDIERYLHDRIERGAVYRETAVKVLADYNESRPEEPNIDSQSLTAKLLTKGIHKRSAKPRGSRVPTQCYMGIKIKEIEIGSGSDTEEDEEVSV